MRENTFFLRKVNLIEFRITTVKGYTPDWELGARTQALVLIIDVCFQRIH